MITETKPTCPECGGELQIEEHVIISTPMPRFWHYGAPAKRMKRAAPAALCGSCEYCVEIV